MYTLCQYFITFFFKKLYKNVFEKCYKFLEPCLQKAHENIVGFLYSVICWF